MPKTPRRCAGCDKEEGSPRWKRPKYLEEEEEDEEGADEDKKAQSKEENTDEGTDEGTAEEDTDEEADGQDVVSPGDALRTFDVREKYYTEDLPVPDRAVLEKFKWDDKTLQQVRKKLDQVLQAMSKSPAREKVFLCGPLYLQLQLFRGLRRTSREGQGYHTVDVVQMGVDYSVARQGHGRRLLQELAAALQRNRNLQNYRVFYQSAIGSGIGFLKTKLIKDGLFEPMPGDPSSALSTPKLHSRSGSQGPAGGPGEKEKKTQS